MAKTIVGLFDGRDEADLVVAELVNNGFNRNDISLAANNVDNQYSDQVNAESGTAAHHTGSAAVTGAETGAVIGGIAGLLVGLGVFAIPGIGPIIAAGPIAATLSGAAVGAVAGGLVGALIHQGVPEDEAHYYTEGVRRGGTLITVNSPDNMARQAVDIMHAHGAVDIDQRAAQYQREGVTGFDSNAQPLTPEEIARNREQYRANRAPAANVQQSAGNGQGTVIPVVEEELVVGKRQVAGGAVRVYNRIIETPVEQQVNLRDENVTVDRRAVNRPLTDADRGAFKEGMVEVTETSEEPVVAKNARVVEEVNINKNVGQRTETVRDTVRRTDVDVQELEGDDLSEDPALRPDRANTSRQ